MSEPKTAEVKVDDRLAEIISDDEITRVHGHASFGSQRPREVVNDGVRKSALGYRCGHTQFCILRDHGLITAPRGMSHDYNLTKKGKKYARALMHDALFRPASPPAGTGEGLLTAEAAWTELSEVDDRTSPEEYPDMCLITFDELADFMARAQPVSPSEGEADKETFARLYREFREWSGSAWIAGERVGKAEERRLKGEMYSWLCRTGNVMVYYADRAPATHPASDQPDTERMRAWDWLAENPNLELSHGYPGEPEDPGAWMVHRVNGGVNDREWTLIALADTPLDAVVKARAALAEKAADK